MTKSTQRTSGFFPHEANHGAPTAGFFARSVGNWSSPPVGKGDFAEKKGQNAPKVTSQTKSDPTVRFDVFFP